MSQSARILALLADGDVLKDRWVSHVEITDDCWLWHGSMKGHYGQIRIPRQGNRKALAHRLAYEWFVGPIAEGLEIDHLCRTPSCVNPAHLEAVTHAENVRRGLVGERARRTHCDKGHALVPENVAYRNDRYERICRACRRARHERHRIKLSFDTEPTRGVNGTGSPSGRVLIEPSLPGPAAVNAASVSNVPGGRSSLTPAAGDQLSLGDAA